MDNQQEKDQNVLLVKEQGKDTVNAVAKEGIAPDGRVKTVKPKSSNRSQFLIIRKGANILESFFENFMHQVRNPTRFQFFQVPVAMVEKAAAEIEAAFKLSDEPESKEVLKKYSAPVANKTESSTQNNPYVIDADRVDWAKLEHQWGIRKDTLEKTGQLDRLLSCQKTDLLAVTAKFDDSVLRTDARLSLRENANGEITFAINAIRKDPELDRPYFGVRFSEEDKRNLTESGNLGRIVEAEYQKGVRTPVLLSLDRQTNEIVAFRAEKVNIPEHIKGVTLTPEQKQALGSGRPVLLENMISSKGTSFSACLQFNADKRTFEFKFDNTPKQENRQSQPRTSKSIPFTFRGRNLSDEQLDSLHEGYTVPIDKLISKDDKVYNGYITWNKETCQLDFMFPAAYKKALEAGKVKADPNYGRFESREREDIAHDIVESVAAQTRVNEALKRQAVKTGEQTPVHTRQRKPRGMRM